MGTCGEVWVLVLLVGVGSVVGVAIDVIGAWMWVLEVRCEMSIGGLMGVSVWLWCVVGACIGCGCVRVAACLVRSNWSITAHFYKST